MRKTVLVVDDSQTIREIVKVYLKGMDVDFVEAPEGARALALCRLMPVNLVVCDIKMPGMDGIEFTRQLRAEPEAERAKLPIILMTGEKEADLRERGLAAGANSFLNKPLSSQELCNLAAPYLTA
jgi:two-component system chemotaxis response regulator CheY